MDKSFPSIQRIPPIINRKHLESSCNETGTPGELDPPTPLNEPSTLKYKFKMKSKHFDFPIHLEDSPNTLGPSRGLRKPVSIKRTLQEEIHFVSNEEDKIGSLE